MAQPSWIIVVVLVVVTDLFVLCIVAMCKGKFPEIDFHGKGTRRLTISFDPEKKQLQHLPPAEALHFHLQDNKSNRKQNGDESLPDMSERAEIASVEVGKACGGDDFSD